MSMSKESIAFLKDYRNKIWNVLSKYIEPQPIPSISPLKNEENEQFFWKQVRDYPLRGGKYIRSTLVVMTCEALGGSTEDALTTAAAMELSQNWILIHDDVEDQSSKRRGKPTLHLRYDVEQAINAGDGLHTIMWKALSDNLRVLDAKKAKLIFDEFYNMILRTCVGQTAELNFRDRWDIDEEDVLYILDGKTGYYTIAGPMRLGAVIAGKEPQKDKKLFENINEFGTNLGRCFQIIDDVLDVTSDFSGLKERGGDIQEGKRSLLLIKLLKKADSFDQKKILKIMNKPVGSKTPAEIDIIISLMEEYGVIDEARTIANEYANKSRNVLSELPFSDIHRQRFEDLITYILTRTK